MFEKTAVWSFWTHYLASLHKLVLAIRIPLDGVTFSSVRATIEVSNQCRRLSQRQASDMKGRIYMAIQGMEINDSYVFPLHYYYYYYYYHQSNLYSLRRRCKTPKYRTPFSMFRRERWSQARGVCIYTGYLAHGNMSSRCYVSIYWLTADIIERMCSD